MFTCLCHFAKYGNSKNKKKLKQIYLYLLWIYNHFLMNLLSLYKRFYFLCQLENRQSLEKVGEMIGLIKL